MDTESETRVGDVGRSSGCRRSTDVTAEAFEVEGLGLQGDEGRQPFSDFLNRRSKEIGDEVRVGQEDFSLLVM